MEMIPSHRLKYVTEQSAIAMETAPDVMAHVDFVRVVDPGSDITLLIANCYQYQMSSPTAQAALLTLVSTVLARWSLQADHVVLCGDWNASLSPRIGYVGSQPTVLADARLRLWSETAGLICAATEDPLTDA
jgi:hypothetical protein